MNVYWSPTSGLDMPEIYEGETGEHDTDNVSIEVWSTEKMDHPVQLQ